jgi:glucokinase
MILAGDIGGTKTVLALIDFHPQTGLQILHEQTFASGEFADFNEILDLFLVHQSQLTAVCLGVAGAVIEQRCQTTNLPWVLDAAELKLKLGVERVKLLNDLEAMALGMLHLPEQDFIELNPQAERHVGNIAVIAAGTGLGEALLFWDGKRHQPIATEGGHASFAPQNAQQDQLLAYLRKIYPEHVSYERLISGMGFGNLYDFLIDSQFGKPCPAVPASSDPDRSAIISRLGVGGEDRVCSEVVRLFVELYGGEAGNLALKGLTIGGVFIGGGIGPKIRSALEAGDFMQAFIAKGRLQLTLEKISVKLALNPRAPLLGAMHYFVDSFVNGA